MDLNQGTSEHHGVYLESWLGRFFVDCRAQNLAGGTLSSDQRKLRMFLNFCEAQAITQVEHLTPDVLRRHLL